MQPVRGAQDLECAQSKLHSLETKLSAIASVGGGGGGPADLADLPERGAPNFPAAINPPRLPYQYEENV